MQPRSNTYQPLGGRAVCWLPMLGVLFILAGCQPAHEPVADSNPWIEELPRHTLLVAANQHRMDDAQFRRWMVTFRPVMQRGMITLQQPLLGQLAWHEPSTWRQWGADPNGFWAIHTDNDGLSAHLSLISAATFWSQWVAMGGPAPSNDQVQKIDETNPDHSPTQVRIELDSLGRLSGVPPSLVLIITTQAMGLSLQLSHSQPNPIVDDPDPVNAPDHSTSSSWSLDEWAQLNQTHGLDGHVTALVQPQWMSHTPLGLNNNCQQQWSTVTESWPAWVFGTDQLIDDQMGLKWLSLRADTNPHSLTGPLGDLTLDQALGADVAGFGVAVEITQLRDAVLSQYRYTQSLRPDCLEASWVAEPRRYATALANRPIPPIITSVQGLMSRFDGAQSDGIHYLTEVYLNNTAFFLNLIQLLSPELASLDLRPDQRPQPVPARFTEGLSSLPVYLSTTQNAIRLSSTDELSRWSAPKPSHAPTSEKARTLLVTTLNFNRIHELTQVLGQGAMVSPLNVVIEELRQIATDMEVDRMSAEVLSSARGLDVRVQLEDQRSSGQ